MDVHSVDLDHLLDLDKVIHERVRLAIMAALSVAESLTFQELKQALKVTDGNLSVHLKLLEKNDYVIVKKHFIGKKPRSNYRLTSSGKCALKEYVHTLEKLLQDIQLKVIPIKESINMNFDIFPQLPQHIAIIMDGNGRWAQLRNKQRIWGHRQGSKTVRKITQECARLKISQLTLYAFSYENWQRPPKEVSYLMTLLRRFLVKERKTIMDNNIRLETVGRVQLLPENVKREIEITRKMSANNTGMVLCLALSYGGRAEIIDATRAIALKVASGEIIADDIDEGTFADNLYQPKMPPVDLLIRTGGEMRISNFLLWQISYTELWVTPVLWPEFEEKHLHRAIEDFCLRERRFGKVPCHA